MFVLSIEAFILSFESLHEQIVHDEKSHKNDEEESCYEVELKYHNLVWDLVVFVHCVFHIIRSILSISPVAIDTHQSDDDC